MEVDFRNAVYTKLKAFGIAEGIAIEHPNTSLDTDQLDEYLRLIVTPLDPTRLTICGTGVVLDWVLQVSVYVRDNTGEVNALKYVDKLKVLLPVLTELLGSSYTYKVIRVGRTIPPVPTDRGWFFIPVQFRIQAII